VKDVMAACTKWYEEKKDICSYKIILTIADKDLKDNFIHRKIDYLKCLMYWDW